MLHNYVYSIGQSFSIFDNLKDARSFQKHLITIDKTSLLYRDNKGFYIKKLYENGTVKSIY